MKHVIELKDIKKIYHIGGEDFAALAGITLNIEEGEFAALMGPSGSGKSTLMNILGCLDRPTSGSYKLGGKEVAHLSDDELAVVRNQHIGFVFQNYALFRYMTVYDNVAFGLEIQKRPKEEIRQRVLEMIELVGLSGMEKRYPNQLSGGQRQRVAIGRAIVRSPKVLLMDEPLSNLDAKLRNQMRAEIIKLREKIDTTFIYVTHDQVEAMTLGDRIVIMRDGFIQQIGTPQEVFNHPANIFVAGFIGVPQMNFFDAQLVRSGNGFTVKTEDMNVALAPETCAQLALNWDGGDVKEITAGVRPEQILLADKDEEGALQGTVEVTELMGSTEHVHVTAPDGQFVLIIPVVDLEAKGALKAGDTIWFKFEKNATHLFDKVSGKNLI